MYVVDYDRTFGPVNVNKFSFSILSNNVNNLGNVEKGNVNVNILSNVINNNKIKVLNLVNQSVDKLNFIGKLIKEKVLNYKNYNNLGVNSFDINIDHSEFKNKRKISPIEISNGEQVIQEKESFDLYEINKRIGKIKVDQMVLNIVTWNLQTLNKDDNQFKKKKQFIFDVLTEVKPDIFFLIDVGKLGNELNFPHYIRFDDKRNFLYTHIGFKFCICEA